MRVLFAVYPSHAHFWPVVPAAWALLAAGHEVRVASHARFSGSVTATGLTAVGLGEADVDEARTRPDARMPDHPDEILRYADALGLDGADREHWIAYHQVILNPISDYLRTDLPYAHELVEIAREWQPDLVIWDGAFGCGGVAARACGAAHARIVPGPDFPAWGHDRLVAGRGALLAAGLEPHPQRELLRPLAEHYGFDPDDELLLGQWTIDPLPVAAGLPTSTVTIPMRYVPFNGAATVPAWLHGGRPERPRVALTLGESTRRFIQGDWGRTPAILEAVAGLDIELVATVNAMQLTGIETIPDNVRIVEWVTLNHLLPTCSAIIHHGGTGTFAAAADANIPQIVCDTGESLMMTPVQIPMPTMEDGSFRVGFEFGVAEEVPMVTSWELPGKKLEAPLTARYVVGRGAGERLDHRAQSVDEIRKMILQVVTEPRYVAGAQAVRDEWAARPAPAGVVAQLEALIAARR